VKQQNYEVGRLGESIARGELTSRGYKIITSNFKTKFGEIDIIASKNNILVFVEVKLKIGDDFGTPEEMINDFKISQVQNTAIAYLQHNPMEEKKYDSYRIDAICIVMSDTKEVLRINHYENINF
jgi:putative endonuclease